MDDLRDLTADEAALSARHPLPEGVPDAVVNKSQLALALNTSEVTVGKWIARGLPFEQEGTNGRPYLFRLSLAFAWVEADRAGRSEARARADEAAGQLAMVLSGGAIKAEAGGMTTAEQAAVMDLVIKRNRAALEQKDLIWRADAVAAFEAAFLLVRDGLEGLPDRLGRELGLEGADLERVERACDDVLSRAAAKVEDFANGIDED